jgi:hypothetical protein
MELDNCQRFAFASLSTATLIRLLLQYPRAIGGGGIQNNYSATFLRASGNVFNRGMIGMAKSFNEYKLLKIPAKIHCGGGERKQERESGKNFNNK